MPCKAIMDSKGAAAFALGEYDTKKVTPMAGIQIYTWFVLLTRPRGRFLILRPNCLCFDFATAPNIASSRKCFLKTHNKDNVTQIQLPWWVLFALRTSFEYVVWEPPGPVRA